MKQIEDNGIVIKKVDFGEADRYITVFTENYGKLSFLLKGIKTAKKKELSCADVLTFSRFNFYERIGKYRLEDFQYIDSFFEIKKDIEKLNITFYIIAILNLILVENNIKKSLYNITLKTLYHLEKNIESTEKYLLVCYYLYYLIKDEGMKINLTDGLRFSFEEAKFFNDFFDEKHIKISMRTKEIVGGIIQNNIKGLLKADYTVEEIKEAIYFFEKFINYHTGIEISLKKYDFL